MFESRSRKVPYVALAGFWLAAASLIFAAGKPLAPGKVPYIVTLRVESIGRALAASSQSSLSSAELSRLSDRMLAVDAAGRLRLSFHARGPVGEAERGALIGAGAEIVMSSAEIPLIAGVDGLGVITAWVPYSQVEAAAALDWVVAVTPVEEPATDAGSVLSEGVALHGADVSQGAGIDGANTAVGVISDGVENLQSAVASGDLPANVTVLSTGQNDEGTAMLEIVHDMAPGADLLFASGIGGGPMGFVDALNDLLDNGARVVAEDLAFDTEPAFQQGVTTFSADSVPLAVSVQSSAGNLGDAHAERVRAVGTGQGPDGNAGPFTGCTLDPTDVVDVDPGAGTAFDATIPAMTSFSIVLQWSEPRAIFPTAGAGGFTDLDLYVMDSAGTTCLLESLTAQADGAGDTIEVISGQNNAMAPLAVKLVVNVAGTSGAVAEPLLDLRWRGLGATDATTRAGSLNPDSNYSGGAKSVAAVDGTSATPQTAALRPYSAGGPINLEQTTVCDGGTYPCPCVDPMNDPCPTAGPPPFNLTAPSWSGADGVMVTGAGTFPSTFSGTSAAVPHTAACTALALQALELRNFTPTAATVHALLTNTAIDRGDPGIDNEFGAGVLDCRFTVPQMMVLLDRTGSMLTVRPSTGRTRCEDALELAKQDVMSFAATSPTGLVAVWTFAGSSPTDLTGGFVDPNTALASLNTLSPTGCDGLTPLADAICASSDALTAAFPDLSGADRILAISSDGGENNSSGPCSGPSSTTGQPYDPGSWQRKVSDQLQGQNVVLSRFWGSVTRSGLDVETGEPLQGGVDDASLLQYLAERSGGVSGVVNDDDPLPPPFFGMVEGDLNEIPTLGTWGIAGLMLILASLGVLVLRRRST